MRFIVQALIVFFATLAAAALIALGDPADGWWAPWGTTATSR